MASGWPLRGFTAGDTIEQVVDVARADIVAREAQRDAARRHALHHNLAALRQCGCRRCSDSAALSMLAKVWSGDWPRSDKRTCCIATAGCGHCCRRTGPSNTSVRSGA